MALEPMVGGSANDAEEDYSELKDMTRRFWIAGILALPVFLLAMGHLIPSDAVRAFAGGETSRWLQFALATPVVFWAALPFFRRGWKSILSGHLNMFTLIAIGVGAAFIFSAVVMLLPGVFPESMAQHGMLPIYFEAAAVIVVMVLLGQVLELRARSRTGSAIKALLNLAPPTTRRISDRGEEVIPLDEVKVGDRLKVVPGEKVPEDDLVKMAASLEQNSEHPLGAAIVAGAKERKISLAEVQDFRSVTAGGVAGNVSGRPVMIGKPDFLRDEKVTGLESLIESAKKLQEEGKTAMFVALGGKSAGIVTVADPIKSTTGEAIKELHELGIKIVMLTGDNRRTADAVAKQLGLDSVEAEVEPAGKVEHVKKLRNGGKLVAMAGDGINDAPALSEADVGIAMGTGTDVAMQSAGITLVKGDLRGIAKAIRLSRATMGNIRQNLFFAFFYNALGIPLAA